MSELYLTLPHRATYANDAVSRFAPAVLGKMKSPGRFLSGAFDFLR
jgi:hypothetical protein